MKILVVGDIHGNLPWMRNYIIPQASKNKCNTIFQVGDFGYWEHSVGGEAFLDYLSEKLVEFKIRMVFLLGNHENWDRIEQYLEPKYDDKQSPEGFRYIRENLYWVPCGTQWKWGPVSFGAMGGAYSIDRASREKGISWWAKETITDERAADVIDATESNSVDVMFAHDVGTDVDMAHHLWVKSGRRIRPIKESVETRHQLQKIVDHWNPNLFIHGHWHVEYYDKIGSTHYYGLHCDGNDEENFCILEVRKDAKVSLTLPARMTSMLVNTKKD